MKVLISVKTYPTISEKYDELVCTAGFTEDGNFIRIYPISYRKLAYDKQYKKYQWIDIELIKNTKDFRKESYRPLSLDTIPVPCELMDTGKNRDWSERKKIVLKNVYTNMDTLIAQARKDATSLAVFKPTKIKRFTWEAVEREWSKEKMASLNQMNIFEKKDDGFKVVSKLPYKFKYEFEDDNGKVSNMMIEDWEIGALFWKYKEDEKLACQKVKEKYFDDFAKERDLYFYLGTTQKYHQKSINPFTIIGTFHPPFPKLKAETQYSLF